MSEPPVQRPRVGRRQRSRAVIVTSALALVFASVLLWLMIGFASNNPDKVNLGRDDFAVGSATRLAGRIAEQQAPFLFKDPLSSGAGRELYVQHIGGDAKKGWLAFDAYAPDAPREVRCVLQWDLDRALFTNPCGASTFDAEGTGLGQYRADVDDNGVVVVNLKDRV